MGKEDTCNQKSNKGTIKDLIMDTTGTIYISLYALAWGVTLWGIIRKNKSGWNAATFIIATYFLFALLSVVYYVDYAGLSAEKLTLFPLIYLYLMMMIGIRPVLTFSNGNYESIEAPSKPLFNALVYFYIFLSIIILPDIIANMQEGLVLLMTDTEGGQELYNLRASSHVQQDAAISNIFAIFYNFLSPTCIFLFFYYLTLPNRKKLILIMLAISVVVRVLDSLSKGQRTEPAMIFLVFLATFFLMKPFFEEKTKKRITVISVGTLVALLIPFMILTNSRFESSEQGSVGGIVSYAGMAPVVFDNYCLDAGGIRYGDRTAPEFKRLVGFSNVPRDESTRRAKYSRLKIDAYWFYTYVGDFVLDYGPIGAFIIFIVFSSVFVGITKHKWGRPYPFHKLLLIYFAMSVCVQGGMYLFNFAHYNNYSIMTIFLLYIVFSADYNHRRKSRALTSSTV